MPDKPTFFSYFISILPTIIVFCVGYGQVMIATGYRYNLIWDWQALISGLVMSGAYHMPSSAIANSLQSMIIGKQA